jgi:phage baseplate assembly protein gpV
VAAAHPSYGETMDTLENVIFRCIERWAAARYSERHGLVTSYDPDTHLAKVMLKPDDVETDWLPIEEGHNGNGYGIAVGLETGDGKETGDQVIVRYQENDFESGKIVQRLHSDEDKPPRVESGEMVMWTKWGQQVRFNKDGSLTLKTGVKTTPMKGQQDQTKNAKKVTVTLDNKGTITTQTDTDQVAQVGRNKTDTIQKDRTVQIKGQRTDNVSKTWSTNAQNTTWPWLTVEGDIDD